MYVLRLFIKTLFLVSVVVSSVLGFIYRNEIMRKVTALSEDVITVLHEQGWIVAGSVVKQEDVVEFSHLSTSPSVPAPVPVTPSQQSVSAPLPSVPPAGTSAKTDYPPDDYIPADPENESQHRPVNKNVVSPQLPSATPPASLPEKGMGRNVPGIYDSEQNIPAFDFSHRADNFAAPFDDFLPPPAPSPENPKPARELPPSSLFYRNGELQAGQNADNTATEDRDVGVVIQPKVVLPYYPLPQSSPPLTTPSYRPDNGNQNEQSIQNNHSSSESPVTQTTQPSLSKRSAHSLTDLPFHPAIPSRSAIDEQQHQKNLRTQPSIALREAWIAARQSFWEKDPVTAEKAYQTLIRDYPDEPDLPGELGNIYLNQGHWQEATSLYYEAGMRALQASNRGQVHAVIRILRQLDPTKAEILRQNVTASHIPW